MRLFYFFIALVLVLSPLSFVSFSPLPVNAQSWSQDDLDTLMADIETTYGIGFAFPEEWQAQHEDEFKLFSAYLETITLALEKTAYTLWVLNASPTTMTLAAHFRFHFDQAKIQIDRVRYIEGGYGGNTMHIYENGRVVSYLIQLAPQGIGTPYTLAHEIGHVMDGLLNDYPQNQHREFLGGAWTTTYWIPGRGYVGNENLFPRAMWGPNEDFADTFGQMMVGNLYFYDTTAPRWLFMTAHTHYWLRLLEVRRAIRELIQVS